MPAPRPLALSRRRLLGGAGAVGLAAAAAACTPGGGGAPGPQGEAGGPLTFWHYYGGGATKPLEDLLARYSSETGTQVEPRLIPFGDFNRTVLQAATGQDLPDVALVNAFDTALFADSGLLLDLSDRVTEWGESDQYFDGPRATTTVGEATFGVPHVCDTYALWRNTALLDGSEAPESWDDLQSLAGGLTGEVRGLAYCAIEGVEGATAWMIRFLAAGGDVREISSEAGVRAMESLVSMSEAGATSPGVLTWNEDDVATQFQQGQAAMMINSASYLADLSDVDGLELAISPMPSDTTQASFLSAENLTITAASPNADAAWELVRWMQQPEIMNEYLPVRNKLPVRRDTAEAEFWQDEIPQTFISQLDVAWAPDETVAPVSAEVFIAVQAAVQSALSGSSTPAEALDTAQAAIDELF